MTVSVESGCCFEICLLTHFLIGSSKTECCHAMEVEDKEPAPEQRARSDLMFTVLPSHLLLCAEHDLLYEAISACDTLKWDAENVCFFHVLISSLTGTSWTE